MTAHTTFIRGELVAIPDLDALIRSMEARRDSERDFGRRVDAVTDRFFHLAAPGSARAMLGGDL